MIRLITRAINKARSHVLVHNEEIEYAGLINLEGRKEA